MKGGLI